MKNYPSGVKPSDFNTPSYFHEFSLTIPDLEIDNGQGLQLAELEATILMTESGFEVDSAQYKLYGNNFEPLGIMAYVEKKHAEHDLKLCNAAYEYDSKHEQNRTFKED